MLTLGARGLVGEEIVIASMVFEKREMLRPFQDVVLGGLVVDLHNRGSLPALVICYEDVIWNSSA
jgi:hypothetical protein